MPSSPADLLYKKLRDTLSDSNYFSNNDKLKLLFDNSQMQAWKHHLPETTSSASRVEQTITYLAEKFDSDGKNGLVLFLQILADYYHPDIKLHHILLDLAQEVQILQPDLPKPLKSRKYLLNQLASCDISLVYGPAGVGKTWVGEQLISYFEKQGKKIFRCIVHDTEDLLTKLAIFLEQQKKTLLKNMMDKTDQNMSLNEKLEMLGNSLSALDTFLWFDDIHQIEEDSTNLHIVKYLVENLPSSCTLFLTGQKTYSWLEEIKVNQIYLLGITEEETAQWFMEKKIILNDTELYSLWRETEGYPVLFPPLQSIIASKGIHEAIIELEKLPPLSQLNYYMKQVWNQRSPIQKKLLELLALLDEPEDQDFLEQCGEVMVFQRDEIRRTLNNLKEWSLLKLSSEGRNIELYHSLFQKFIKEELGILNKTLHQHIAFVYEQKSNANGWLQASKHYLKGQLFIKSAKILTENGKKLLLASKNKETLSILQEFRDNQFMEDIQLWQEVLLTRAQFAFHLGNYDIAIDSYSELYNLTQNPEWLLELGRVYNRKGDYTGVFSTMERILSIEDLSGDSLKYLKAQAHIEMARAHSDSREDKQAIPLFKQGLLVYGINLTQAETSSLKLAERALKLSTISDDHRNDIAWALRHAGLVYIRLGQIAAAIACWSQARVLWEILGDKVNKAAMQVNLGAVYFDLDIDLAKAETYLTEARPILEEYQALYDLLRLYNNLAYLHYRQGKFKDALDVSMQLFNLHKKGFPMQIAEALDVQGAIYMAVGEWEKAETNYKEAIKSGKDLAGVVKSTLNLGLSYLAWGRQLIGQENISEGNTKYSEAKKQFNKAEKLIDQSPEEADPNDVIEINIGLAESLFKTLEITEAQATIEQVEVTDDELFFVKARYERVLGELAMGNGKLMEAQTHFVKAWEILSDDSDSHGIDIEELWVLQDLVAVYEQLGQVSEHEKYKAILIKRELIYKL